MSKADLLIEYIVSDIVGCIIEDNKIGIGEAMAIFYSSRIFENLHDVETGLYLSGSAYVYELFKEEREDTLIV